MPHEAFKPIANALPLQLGERIAHQLQRQRVHLETDRLVRIPVAAEVRAAGRTLDYGHRRINGLRHPPRKTQLRPDGVVDWLQCHPAIAVCLVFPSDRIGKTDSLLRLLQPGIRREVFDVLHLRVGTDHVGLPRKNENPNRGVIGRLA